LSDIICAIRNCSAVAWNSIMPIQYKEMQDRISD
jgi:hypothetical protein